MGTPTTVWEAGQTPINSAKGLVRKGTAGSLYPVYSPTYSVAVFYRNSFLKPRECASFRLLRNGYYCQYVHNPLTEATVMVPFLKGIGVVFYGLLLNLGPTAAQADVDWRQGDQGVSERNTIASAEGRPASS